MDATTVDVKANCEDLKVLGKGDFKALIRWRLALREEVRCNLSHLRAAPHVLSLPQLGLDVKTKPAEEATETVEITEEVDEEQAIQDEVSRLTPPLRLRYTISYHVPSCLA